jgi:hypothetical protein
MELDVEAFSLMINLLPISTLFGACSIRYPILIIHAAVFGKR